jgi:hypothetical protein
LLLPDSARLAKSPFSPDSSGRYLPGHPYSPGCVARIDADRWGFTLLVALLTARGERTSMLATWALAIRC